MSKNFKIILITGIILGSSVYLMFRNELRAGIEFAKMPFIAQREVSPSRKAVEVAPWAKINLEKVFSGFKEPLYLVEAKDDSGNIYVVEKGGKIISLKNKTKTTFLDISDRVRDRESERGLLSVAFHPDFKNNGRYFVYYTNSRGAVIVSEFNSATGNQSEKVLLKISQPYSNHNGGQLDFGHDGYLYIGTGDGGAGGDPLDNGQNKLSLLGKILRIDVNNGSPYGIPHDNPFVNKSGEDEIWAYGLRNPWRFSFDTKTGDLYNADVGQNEWEEINFQPASSKGGENYGWRILEGFHTFKNDNNTNIDSLTMPVMEYNHSEGCSVTGGYVYRGEQYKQLDGTYFFGDFCTGNIWGLRNKNGEWEYAKFLKTDHLISSFGQDQAGNIYVIDFKTGDIYRIFSN